jgi:circadian clock protein KaiC
MTDSTTSDRSQTRGTAAAARPAERPRLRQLRTGVPGLDAVLGGGLPEYSFNMLAGGPGAGKTTLAQQILYANATPERPAIYFTVLGEPTVKMLRYQRQFGFFRPELVGTSVHYLNLSEEVLSGDLDAVLARMTSEVERLHPGIVVVDSFRTIGASLHASERNREGGEGARHEMELEHFVQRLALHLASWEVTSVLIGEYERPDERQPLFTIADGILWLMQVTDRNSVVRKLQAIKVRGQPQMPGLHTFRIGDDGLQVFPRIPEQQLNRQSHEPSVARLPTGVPGLDALMDGGVPAGDAVLLAGPTGSGKSTFAMQFAADGLRRGEAVVVIVFEEYPEAYIARLRTFDVDPDAMIAADKLRIRYLRPLDLSVDETLDDLLLSVKETGARRVVIDSLTGFEVALAPAFREDFRESLYRLVGALTATQITVFMTMEAVAMSADAGFTGERVSFITDDIVVLRYIELNSVLQKVVAVAKMRRSKHSLQFWQYAIHETGATIGEPLDGYSAILSGSPEREQPVSTDSRVGLTGDEVAVLNALVRSGEASLDALASSAGLSKVAIEPVVARLVALDYAVSVEAPDGAPVYRAVARAAVK